MKAEFERLKAKFQEVSKNEQFELLEDFFNELVKTDRKFIDVGKRFSSYGTYKSVPFVNEYYTGKELEDLLSTAMSGKITHDEDHEFEISDFKEEILDKIYTHLW